MRRCGRGCKELKVFSSGRLGQSLLFAGLEVKDSGRVSFADGSSVTAADRKVQGWNSQSDRGGEPSGLDSGLIFTPISTLTGGVATS